MNFDYFCVPNKEKRKMSQALDKLYSLEKFGIKLGLEKSYKLCEYLGNPQNKFKSIHVAGTNGKGSTCSFLSSILQENGSKVGLYTSPHFVRFNERIRINGAEISDSYIESFINEIWEYIEVIKPTFFEVTTVLAFKYFADSQVDFAVIETGLGGKYDSTNVIMPIASVITSISLDHTQYLGNTIAEIASEKAGIIKEKIPVFIGNLCFDAQHKIENEANNKLASVYRLNEYLQASGNKYYILDSNCKLPINPGLNGEYQYYNASLAALISTKLLKIEPTIINNGLNNVVINTAISGRFEYFHQNPDVIFDSAHNVEGIATFVKSFEKIEKQYDSKILIFGVMKDKTYTEMLNILENHFDKILFADISYDRAMNKSDLIKIYNDQLKFFITDDASIEIENFVNDGNNKTNVMVFVGSMYVLGEIKAKLKHT